MNTAYAILNYTTNTALMYLLVLCGLGVLRGMFWFLRLTRDSRILGENFTQKADDVAAIAGREVEPRTLEYWHEPLCWIHTGYGLLCFWIAPWMGIMAIRGYATKPWLTGGEYLTVLAFAVVVAALLFFWIRSARKNQFSVTEEGIVFKRGLRHSLLMRWEDVTEAEVMGRRPLLAGVRGMASDGKEHLLTLNNGFYKRGDFETITYKLLGRRRPQPE